MKKSFAVKNLSKTIIISNEVLPTMGEEKIDFKNSILKPFKKLIGNASWHCGEKTNKSFLPFLRGGLRRGDSSFETPIIKVFQKKKKDSTSPLTPLLNEEREHKHAAFTLAETMIVLVVLGVVAAITVPALVNRHVEAERRTKLKKAMSVYDTALNKMVIENGIKSDTALADWADSNTKNDCANTAAYFKTARTLEVNGNTTNCKFRAPDGVFWDISDIQKPLIALREEDLNEATAQSGTNRAFHMYGWFDEQGSLRSNDLGKIDADNKADLQKLYDYINGKSTTSLAKLSEESEESEEEQIPNSDKILNLLKEYCPPDPGSYYEGLFFCRNYGYNEKKCKDGEFISCVGYNPNCYDGIDFYDENGTKIATKNVYHPAMTTIWEYKYDENGNIIGYMTYDCTTSGCSEPVEQNNLSSISGSVTLNSDNSACFTCLVKGTLITMADGTQKPIEYIQNGDFVMSVNPKTWELEPTPVLACDSNMVKFANESDKWYFEDGTIIETAHRHRFYNLEHNTVKYMDEWQIGEHACKIDGTNPKLVKHEKIDGDCQHFTLFTANQTYFANGLMSGNRHTLKFGEERKIRQTALA